MSLPPGLAAERDRLKAWLVERVYPRWWTSGADMAGGGFHDRLDAAGRPIAGPKRCRVQARQVFAYSLAAGFGWQGPWREVMDHGHQVLETRFKRADGLYRTRLAAPPDDAVDLYDQAFVLLAEAALSDHGDTGAKARALALFALLPSEDAGGFAELEGQARQANPNMHLFEAFLAWEWRDIAAGQARLAQSALIDPETGAVSETFAPGWKAPAQRRVEPGHQFEWGFLLMRHAWRSGDGAALAAGLRLVELGERSGVDRTRNVAINALDERLAVVDPGTRLWPQTERLRAHLLAGVLTGDSGCWKNATRAAAGLALFLIEDGRWIDSLEGDDRFAPASSLYHIVGAIAQLGEAVEGVDATPPPPPGSAGPPPGGGRKVS